MEPLRSTPLTLIFPYGMSEDKVILTVDAPGPKENSPIESQHIESPNLGDNLVKTLPETIVPNTKSEVDPSETSHA